MFSQRPPDSPLDTALALGNLRACIAVLMLKKSWRRSGLCATASRSVFPKPDWRAWRTICCTWRRKPQFPPNQFRGHCCRLRIGIGVPGGRVSIDARLDWLAHACFENLRASGPLHGTFSGSGRGVEHGTARGRRHFFSVHRRGAIETQPRAQTPARIAFARPRRGHAPAHERSRDDPQPWPADRLVAAANYDPLRASALP